MAYRPLAPSSASFHFGLIRIWPNPSGDEDHVHERNAVKGTDGSAWPEWYSPRWVPRPPSQIPSFYFPINLWARSTTHSARRQRCRVSYHDFSTVSEATNLFPKKCLCRRWHEFWKLGIRQASGNSKLPTLGSYKPISLRKQQANIWNLLMTVEMAAGSGRGNLKILVHCLDESWISGTEERRVLFDW